ncbi:MAG: hypothetical protein A2528_01085 [Candidatus Staskawiczbacteria bacterium RIFOXYD2_FULL_37_9]|uniref:Core-binding (CB) domain-containing protein n=1 Tax=Candidatus Staskawiczbacteria bacterium RIFOXYB1_FULL_37_44 TaxID=1802223 RepID=A0A1G2IVR8_9BACT|nr:MAG: hypothetical protein A2358_00605 [Candidatus Staskawiczbacteria bacterium RIFOXYB1_FULL_37_44]OGZ83929.1 MAG: hypothetical protein A2416_01500 [Candidatus Staskawiczbacteria bacterium RIFOXYC1_FULL_37_52]OGZ88972.1 MAG: hypothetical protein A2444_00550 [Candidatus Staskawiczbacteria bacterium RIFOXYC2_FULL_37_19]OGZ94339.1 MAG: hypothetical protein A2528_01085 [Candidatus Staskawiczbacteria bacterium RIFOXYD2_FULL_37_9]
MEKFNNLYTFVEFAKGNRKYPENTANNLKSALKIFEKILTDDELESVSLIENRIDEIFLNVVTNNKNKSIGSLNTYKARVLKVINDYKRYGQNPSKIQGWVPRLRQGSGGQRKNSTPLLNKKDKQDKDLSELSSPTHNPVNNVHKIELALDSPDSMAILQIPKNITASEAEILKLIIDSLLKK